MNGPKNVDAIILCQKRNRGIRQEKREVWATSDLEWLPQRVDWKDLGSIVCVRSTRIINTQSTVELRFYISSSAANAELLGKVFEVIGG